MATFWTLLGRVALASTVAISRDFVTLENGTALMADVVIGGESISELFLECATDCDADVRQYGPECHRGVCVRGACVAIPLASGDGVDEPCGYEGLGRCEYGRYTATGSGQQDAVTCATRLRFKDVDMNNNNGCGVATGDGTVYCWGTLENGANSGTTTGDGVFMYGDTFLNTWQHRYAPQHYYPLPVRKIENYEEALTGMDRVAMSRPPGLNTAVCAWATDGDIACWGGNVHCQAGVTLGHPPTPNIYMWPMDDYPYWDVIRATRPDVPVGLQVHDLCMGEATACLVGYDPAGPGTRSVYCWGTNVYRLQDDPDYLTLADGGLRPHELPSVAGIIAAHGGSEPESVACGAHHACFLLDDRQSIYCWGKNDVRAVDPTNTTGPEVPCYYEQSVCYPSPTEVSSMAGWNPSSTPVRAVYAGGTTTCVAFDAPTSMPAFHATAASSLWCWGAGPARFSASLDVIPEVPYPIYLSFNTSALVRDMFIFDGWNSDGACILEDDSRGRVFCWGSEAYNGWAGDINIGDYPYPYLPAKLPKPATRIAGASSVMAILEDGRVLGWGNGWNGNLGTGFTVDFQTPGPLGHGPPVPHWILPVDMAPAPLVFP